MSTLYLDLKSLLDASGQAKKAAAEAGEYALAIRQKLVRQIDSLSGRQSGEMEEAKKYLERKIKKLERKNGQFLSLSREMAQFVQEAEAADRKVASRFRGEFQDFKRSSHLRIHPAAAAAVWLWNGQANTHVFFRIVEDFRQSMGEKMQWGKDAVRQWYKGSGGEYFVDAALAAAEMTIAAFTISAFLAGTGGVGVVAFLASFFALANGMTKTTSSLLAFLNRDSPAWARRTANIDKLSTYLQKTVYDSSFGNQLSLGIGAILNLTESLVAIADWGAGLYELGKKLPGARSALTAKKTGLASQFLDQTRTDGGGKSKVTLESLRNGFKTILTDERYRRSVAKTFKQDLTRNKNSVKDMFFRLKEGDQKERWNVAKELGRKYKTIHKDEKYWKTDNMENTLKSLEHVKETAGRAAGMLSGEYTALDFTAEKVEFFNLYKNSSVTISDFLDQGKIVDSIKALKESGSWRKYAGKPWKKHQEETQTRMQKEGAGYGKAKEGGSGKGSYGSGGNPAWAGAI